MPKIKIYIDADGTEHRVGPNSESRFLEEHDGAEFLREEYVFGDNQSLNELYNKEDFDFAPVLNKKEVKEEKEEEEEEEDPSETYTYQTSTQGDDFKSGWFKTTLESPTGEVKTIPVTEDEVPNDQMDAWRTSTMDIFNENPDDVSTQEMMEIMRPDRDQFKKEDTRVQGGLDDYLKTKKEKAPIKPTSTSTIPQTALIGDSDMGDMAYVQGNVAAATKEMSVYNTQNNLYNQKQEINNNSEFAEYYRKAQKRLANLDKPASEEETIAEAKRIAKSEYNAKVIKRNLTQLAEKRDKTSRVRSPGLDDILGDVEDYYSDIGTRLDKDGNPVMGPKMQQSFDETNLTENFLENNSTAIAEDKKLIDEKQKYWRDKYDNVESKLKEYSDVPTTIDALNDLNTQIKSYSDRAEGGALAEKDYNEYIALVNKYNSVYEPNKDNIKSYIDLQKQYQDIDFEYKSKETKGGKKDIDDMIGSYNSLIQGQNDLYKTYELQINDQNGMIEDEQDLGIYLDVMDRNHNNFVQFGNIVTNSLIDIGMTVESATHALNPRTLITDGLKEYYKGDPNSAPDLVKGLFMANDLKNIPRENARDAVKGVQDYLSGSIQERVQWKDLGDGIDDGYEWGEYILGSAADFIPQLGLMLAAPQSSLYVLAASSAGGKYEQLKEENQHGANYSMADIYFASAITGVSEYATERVTLGLLNKTGGLLGKIRNEGWERGIAKIFNPKNLGRGVYDVASESTSEVFAKIGENFGDKVAGKNVSIYEGIDEAAFNGLVMSGIMKTPVAFRQAISPFMRPEDSYVIQKNDKKIINIEKQLQNPDLSEDAKNILRGKLDGILVENNKLLSKIIDNVDDMTTEEKKVVIESDKKLHETKELIDQINNDKSIKQEDKAKLIKDATNEYYESRKAKNEVLKEVNLRHDIKTAEKAAKKIGIETFETVETRNEFQKQYEKLTGKKDNKRNSDAFIVGNKVYINKTRAKEVGAVSAGSHELLHGIMNSVINDAEGNLTKEGSVLVKSFLNSLSSKERAVVEKRIKDNYLYERYEVVDGVRQGVKETKRNFEEYAEEYLNSYADAIRKKQINPGEGTLASIGRNIGDFFYGKGYENLEFNRGRDVKNFLKDYTKDIKLGEVRQSILDVAGPEGAKIGKVKMSESAFEDATVVEDLGLKDSTVKIVEKNKKINDVILREGIKDKDGNIMASPAMQKALAENNLPRAFALAKQAAGKANDLTLEEALKMNDVMEWYSEYALKLTELARTYRAVKDGKQVPFGAYMNTLLPVKYSGILNKLKNKIQASSMSEEVTAKEVGKIATPSEELANNEVEGKKVALNTIGEQATQERLVNIVKEDTSLSKLRRYKEVKSELVAHDKPKKKSNRKPIGKLYKALQAVSEGIFGVDATRILQEQDLTTEQRKAAQDLILKFTPQIIAMMPFGTTASGDATGVANTKLGIFYKKLARTKMKATGTGKGLATQQKQNIDPTKFRELVGLVKGGRINNTSVDGAIRAIIVQVAAIASNQAVRQVYGPETLPLKDGKASAMFSETYQAPFLQEMGELSRLMQEEQGSWESIAKRFGFDPIDMNTDFGRNEFENWMFNNLNQYLPLSFFQHSGNWSGTTVGAIEADGTEIRLHARNLVYKNVVELNEAIEAAMQDGRTWNGEGMSEKDKQDITNALFRVKLTNSSLTDVEFKASKKRGFELIWKQFDKMMEDNPNNARGILALLSSSSSQQNHFMRTGSTNEFTNLENGVTVEEHQQPATDLAKFLFNRLAEKNLFKGDTFKNAVAGYQQGPLLKVDDNKLNTPTINYQSNAGEFMYPIFAGIMPIWVRYFNPNVNANNSGINPNAYKLANGNTIAQEYGVNVAPELTTPSVIAKQQDLLFQIFTGLTTQAKAAKAINSLANVKVKQNIKESKTLNNAVKMSQTVNEPKGITVLDFDDTLATTESLVRFTAPDGTKGTLNAEQYASTYEDLLGQGYKFDFTEFDKVVKGKLAPLFQKAMKLQGKFGPKNMFVLTARPPAAQKAIRDFLKANGLNIPLKNITGLGNSTAEAKALWIADKVGEGYNDFYFADDALQNVQAVKNMLDQFDVKSKVQQAKVKFSETMNENFNDILENVTGIESNKRFSDIKARKRGDDKGKFRFFIPPSHEDFVGLLYNFMGKGKEGNAHRNFFETALVRPLNRAYREIDTAKQAIANDYKALNKQFPDVKGKLIKNTPDGDFTFQDAIRVYLWNKHGYKIPGLTPTDQANLVDMVMKDPELQAYAETLNVISKQEKYVDPGQSWENGNIRIDLVDATGRVGRKQYFAEFNENVEVMFSPENLNKIEAAYGRNFREALEDMLHRIKTGVNRPKGASAKPNMFMNWLNASVSGVMFFNTRSALLQQLSNVNFLNFADNNIYAAGKAFANQKQYWKDFAMIFNSDMIKQRRGGLQTDINGAELAEAIKKARPDNMFDQVAIITGKALRLGFLPTQIGDNIAIATGGAAFYRNRVNKYIKDGLTAKEAESKAFIDLQDITNSTQQSARPDMSSQQQSMWIGKLVLNFLNTPSQYNRIIKKAGSDILNRRITPPNTSQTQSDMSNTSRILYYGAAQNLIFYSLQTALFAVMFGGEDEDEEKRVEQFLKKKERVINGAIDTILRGSGIYGVAVSTLKNMIIKFAEQREKGYNKDESAVLVEALNFSPVLGIKARRIVNAEKTINYNESVMSEMETFDAENPVWSAVTNYTQSITGAPVNKIYQKTINLRNAADNQYTALQRALFLSGYTTWSLNLGDTEKMKEVKETVKEKKKVESKVKSDIKKKEKQVVEQKKINDQIEKEKQQEKEGKLKDPKCSNVSSKGARCNISVAKAGDKCTVHESVPQNKTGAKTQCKKVKEGGKRCGMQTSSKSGYCYYHD